jgi:transposase InsO family protein
LPSVSPPQGSWRNLHGPYFGFSVGSNQWRFVAWAFEDYNTVKPKQRLGWLMPKEFHAKLTENPQKEV